MTKTLNAVWELTNGEWNLIVMGSRRRRSAATVYPNGTWHTWDLDGYGGENSREATVDLAKREAEDSALSQGYL